MGPRALQRREGQAQSTTLLMLIVALLACGIPGLRAARLDPSERRADQDAACPSYEREGEPDWLDGRHTHGIFARDGRDMLWMNGGTIGHRSFLGFDPAARIGVAVLANCSTLPGGPLGINDVDNIGLYLLRFTLACEQPAE